MERFLVLVAVLLIGLIGCSMSQDVSEAEKSVAAFHKLLDDQQYELIFKSSSAELQKAVTQEAFIQRMRTVHNKLGIVVHTSKQAWSVNANTSGTLVTLSTETRFANGVATEEFIFRIDDKMPVLMRYNVVSSALVGE
jgi:hypothetical protein